jgi:hypothetical protein
MIRSFSNKNLIEVYKQINDFLENWEKEKAKEIINDIEQLNILANSRLKKHLNKISRWLLLHKDKWLEEVDIEAQIKELLNKIESEFWYYIIDEVAILKYREDRINPIYFYSINIDRIKDIEWDDDKIQDLKDDLKWNMHFFIENIIKKWLLSDGEWTLTWHWTWASYDIIIRQWEYIFGFNNTTETIESLKENFWINPEKIIKEISNFLYNMIK